jgi:hypothetical protein
MTAFVKLRVGLLSPEHVDAIGPALWVFLWMLARADWKTGVIHQWTDDECARALGVKLRTVREHRRRLEQGEYIVSKRSNYFLRITIANWVDPRRESDRKASLSDAQSDVQSDIQIIRGDVTLHPYSDTRNQRGADAPSPLPRFSRRNGRKEKEPAGFAAIAEYQRRNGVRDG